MRTFPRAQAARRLCLLLLLAASHHLAGTAVAGEPAIQRSSSQPRFATFEEMRARLSDSDRVAALTALSMALDHAGDGVVFTWRRHDSPLKGIIKPTAAFRNVDGEICRHVIYGLALGEYRKQIEVVACRTAGGGWRL